MAPANTNSHAAIQQRVQRVKEQVDEMAAKQEERMKRFHFKPKPQNTESKQSNSTEQTAKQKQTTDETKHGAETDPRART
ncbi:hypothetical protein AJ79_05888 [Helicocarpus griseus UAMH5409]|uniref:Uncharacterized protein n=1 Tax=Helicocarpus griseus UAMH5409 TaxID=1447875 RepID=A0A2B7XIP9_9EURO|nr:hypothetical protein AJ79_05888 [Helicocarpus griseus UAMH5409]